jgi:hypothetical protein
VKKRVKGIAVDSLNSEIFNGIDFSCPSNISGEKKTRIIKNLFIFVGRF